ncbi:MAG: beta-lactamase family protein [Candidatus Thermoplasmatota archaeon]|nr:beta-lactamase family protein [Candidatus Thermoplasmatota archaeon]
MKKNAMRIITLTCIFLFIGTISIPAQAHTTVLLEKTTDQPHALIPDTAFDQRISVLMRIVGFRALSACIIQHDHIVWSNGYGFYDTSKEQHATVNTIYLLASVTKTIVGTALMQLYEQGLFDLDDDVNLYLPFELRNPNFPDDPITIRMLLSHTSSLNTNTQMQYYWMNFSGDPPFEFFPDPYLREFLLPGGRYYDQSVWSTRYRPGEQAMYANVGFDLISYLVELISGEPFLDYCDAHIFTPLDMQDTSFNLSRLPLERVAVPHQRFAGKYYTIDAMTFLFGEYTPPEQYWRGRFYPAGGLYSTVSDLSHFLIAHMNNGVYNGTRILQNDTVSLMHTFQPGNSLRYGLAWMQTQISNKLTASGHAGDLHGVDTWMLYNETDDTGIIYLANGNPGYSLLPLRGMITCRIILALLFIKQGFLRQQTRQPLTFSSDVLFQEQQLLPQFMKN